MIQQSQRTQFVCPGDRIPISRAVHLGRLARFYPACRQCEYRGDTGTLSDRLVAQLAATAADAGPRSLFYEEGVAGVYLNELGAAAVRDIAAGFGVWLQRSMASDGPSTEPPCPALVLAGDGRPLTSELVAAASEGLRWAGCDVVDLGAASSACLTFAVDRLQAAGGLLVGNPGHEPHMVGLKFWAAGPKPLSAGGRLDALRKTCQAGVDRPTRVYGKLRRHRAEMAYLEQMAEHYHALRPLRFVVNTACDSLSRYLAKLTESVACRILLSRVSTDRLPERIANEVAHFAVSIDGDGESCHLFDEAGRPVSPEALTLLLARYLLQENPRRVIVLDSETSTATAEAVRSLGGRVVVSDARRETVEQAMREHNALLAGGTTGRYWYARDNHFAPDALTTLTLLLALLSQSDRRLSEVVDRAL